MGVPSVMPCSIPDWSWTRSFSSRYFNPRQLSTRAASAVYPLTGVVRLLWPGRLRLS